jgi:hypothetical protein
MKSCSLHTIKNQLYSLYLKIGVENFKAMGMQWRVWEREGYYQDILSNQYVIDMLATIPIVVEQFPDDKLFETELYYQVQLLSVSHHQIDQN